MFLIFISGCSNTPAEKKSVSKYDLAVKKLSITSEELDSIGREKDLYVKVLDDMESQQSEFGYLFNSQQMFYEMRILSDWHYDIAQRERAISFEHALNIYDAHIQAMKKYADSNDTFSK